MNTHSSTVFAIAATTNSNLKTERSMQAELSHTTVLITLGMLLQMSDSISCLLQRKHTVCCSQSLYDSFSTLLPYFIIPSISRLCNIK
jgi:hypothetical protein